MGMCSLCRLPVAKNHNFGQILTFGGVLHRHPFTNDGLIWRAIADTWYTLTCQNSSQSVFSVALWRRKTTIFAVFGLQHFVVSTVGGNLRKLNTGVQLQTFPCPMVSKSFLYSNAFLAKSCVQKTTKNSMCLAAPMAGEIRAAPNLALWQRTSSTFLHLYKTFGVRCIVSPLWGDQNLGNLTPST